MSGVPQPPLRVGEDLVRGLHRDEALGRRLRVDAVALRRVRVVAPREQAVLLAQLRVGAAADERVGGT